MLDLFAGSGTVAHAVFELNKEDGSNRKFISIQIPELIDKKRPAYMEGYRNIAEVCKERMCRAIKRIDVGEIKRNVKMDLGFKAFRLAKLSFRIWENYDGKDVEKLKEQVRLFESPLVENADDLDVICECMIKEGFSLNGRIEKTDIKKNT